jgi:hypothetical protein
VHAITELKRGYGSTFPATMELGSIESCGSLSLASGREGLSMLNTADVLIEGLRSLLAAKMDEAGIGEEATPKNLTPLHHRRRIERDFGKPTNICHTSCIFK